MFLLVDYSPSMHFATRTAYKSVIAAYTAALIAWSASLNSDSIGSMIVGPSHLPVTEFKKRKRGVLPLLHNLTTHYNQFDNNMLQALLHCHYRLKMHSDIYILSDFAAFHESKNQLIALAKHHRLHFCNLAGASLLIFRSVLCLH